MEFSEPQWVGLREHAAKRGLLFLSSPFSLQAIELLERVGVAGWKVASGEVSDPASLDAMAKTKLPILLSTGMSPLDEIDAVVQRLQQQGMDVGAYLEAMGMTAESLAAEFREPAEQAVRVDLGLRSIAEAEGMNPDDEKLDEQLEVMAGMSGQSATELRERLAEVGQLSVLRADLGKQAAMEWLTENVELIDENGDPIDRAALEIPEEDAEGSDDSADSTDLPDSPDSVDSTDSEEE